MLSYYKTDEEDVQCQKMTFFRYEDLRALDGGSDGLAIIVPILKWGSNILRSGLVNFTNLLYGRLLQKIRPFYSCYRQPFKTV